MKKTWKPIVAGLLLLPASVPYLIATVAVLRNPPNLPQEVGGGEAWAPVGLIIWMPFALPLILGGIAALMRKAWGLAFIGAAAPLVLTVILSPWRSTDIGTASFFDAAIPSVRILVVVSVYVAMVAAVVLLILSRKEFVGRRSVGEQLYGYHR